MGRDLPDVSLKLRLGGLPCGFAGFVTDDIVLAEAKKAVGPWQLRRFRRSDAGWDPAWSTVTARNGTVWILHTEQNAPSWRVLLTRIRDASIKTTTLASTDTQQPPRVGGGDEYGGLSVGRDGCVWASWAQPAATGRPVMIVTKRC